MAASCNRRAILTQILPILDGMSGKLVAIYGMFTAFSGALSMIQGGPTAIVNEVAGKQVQQLAKINKSVNRARNIASSAISTARSIASGAGSAVKKIAARVESTLSSPIGSLYLNKALTGLSASALERLMEFTVGIPFKLDALVGRGRIALAIQSVLNFIGAGETASLAYAQLLADDLREVSVSLKEHLGELETDLINLYGYIHMLYDGEWWGQILADVDEARELLELAEGQLASVEAFLESENMFDPSRFDAAMSNVESARNRLSPGKILDMLSPSGAKKALSDAINDVLDIGQTSGRIATSVVRVSLEVEQAMDLVSAIVTLEREWSRASSKASKFVSAISTFRSRILNVAEDMQEAVTKKDGLSLTGKQAEWLIKLTLAEGSVNLTFNSITRELLRNRSEFAMQNYLFQEMKSDLMLIDPISFAATRTSIVEILKTVPSLAAGAPAKGVTIQGKIDKMSKQTHSAVRDVREITGQVNGVIAAIGPFSGFSDSRLDTLLGVLASFKFEGWESLLRFGRLGDLLEFSTEWLTRAGLALRCLHAVIPESPPAQRAYLQELTDRLRSHKAIEERLIFREDELQGKYQTSLDSEEASFKAIQENTDRLKDSMEEAEEGNPNSPANMFRSAKSTIAGDKTLNSEERVAREKSAREDYHLSQRGLA